MARKSRVTHRFEATSEQRRMVEQMSAAGIAHEQQALVLEISADTLFRHFDKELKTGRVKANLRMAGALYNNGLKGNVTAQIFWLKTRAGWKDFESEVGDQAVTLIFKRGRDRPSVKKEDDAGSEAA